MKTIQVAELQRLIPNLFDHAGEEYVVLDEKAKEIVGAIRIIDAPKSVTMNVEYLKRKDGWDV